MKAFFVFAVAVALISGCGGRHDDSVVTADEIVPTLIAAPAVEPKFEQLVFITIKVDDVDAYRTRIAAYAKVSRTESGNVLYDVYQSIENPAQFEVHETWRTEATHTAHLATPVYKAYSDQVGLSFAAPVVKQRIN